MSQHDEHNPPKDAEKPSYGQPDRLGEDDKEGLPVTDSIENGPSLMDTVADPDIDANPAEEIEEKGEPFEGNHA
jgi:hypothetical protein